MTVLHSALGPQARRRCGRPRLHARGPAPTREEFEGSPLEAERGRRGGRTPRQARTETAKLGHWHLLFSGFDAMSGAASRIKSPWPIRHAGDGQATPGSIWRVARSWIRKVGASAGAVLDAKRDPEMRSPPFEEG
ncbi:hypothetical protein GCM10023089_18590 [Quisquiliibacterium transsilvanicum]